MRGLDQILTRGAPPATLAGHFFARTEPHTYSDMTTTPDIKRDVIGRFSLGTQTAPPADVLGTANTVTLADIQAFVDAEHRNQILIDRDSERAGEEPGEATWGSAVDSLDQAPDDFIEDYTTVDAETFSAAFRARAELEGYETELPAVVSPARDHTAGTKLTDDKRSVIGEHGSAVTGDDRQPNVEAVCSGANAVVLWAEPNGAYKARAEFTDVNMVKFACSVNGWDDEDDPRANDWLDDNSTAITAFLAVKGLEAQRFEWDDDVFTVTADVAPVGAETVTFGMAKAIFDDSKAVSYVRAGLSDPNSGMDEEMAGFIARYEDGDNCDECGADLTDNEGYDGLCGEHADQAERDGKFD